MGRHVRVQPPGGIHHVTARGIRRSHIYVDDRDCLRFLADLTGVAARLGWRAYGYCLLPNHYHLVIQTVEPNLSAGMHRLNGVYARRFNLRHGFEGHLFERRFHSVLVEGPGHLLELLRYLALNPVRAGLCARPADWRWSSYGAVAGLTAAPGVLAVDAVLSQFSPVRRRARTRFAAFMTDAPPVRI